VDATLISEVALTVSVFSLMLQFRRWWEDGVKLSVSVYPDAKRFDNDMKPLDDNTYVQVVVTHRGSAPTTITRMVFYEYPSELAIYIPQRLRRWKWMRGLLSGAKLELGQGVRVFVADSGTLCRIPSLLQPGTYWIGEVRHTSDLNIAIESGRLYAGIICSHSDKTLFKRLKRRNDPSARGMVPATRLD
jgi:hypothetical protein